MKNAIVCLIGLVFVVSVSAEPLLEGRVRLESGEPVADAQVRLFDLTDLRQGAIARAQTDGTGYFALPLAALRGSVLPEGFALGSNYPNPFNPSTIIPYQLAASSAVRLEVFNLLGQRIATLVDGERAAGFHTATWHATDAAGRAVGAGVYIYRMTVGAASQTGRMVLIDGQAGVVAAGAASVWSGVFGGGGSDGAGEQAYGLIVSGEGLVPYVDSAFRVEAGMTLVELVVSAGPHQAGKVTDLFDALNDAEEEEETRPRGKAQATLEAPPEPTNLRFEAVTDSSCLVRWDAAAGATDYDVNYKRAVGGTWTNEPHKGTRLYTTIYDLEPGTEYRWAARAENRDGASEWVFGPNFTTLPEEEEDEAMEEEEEEMQEEEMQEEEEGEAPEEVADDTPVTIPDANLRAAIAAELGLPEGSSLTAEDLASLKGFEARTRGIRRLDGLEHCTALEWLWLSYNQITDVGPLANLTNLTNLKLSHNRITDVGPLANLTNLRVLYLSRNQIAGVGPLANKRGMFDLRLSHNRIADVGPLANLGGLHWLYLSHNRIADVGPLANLANLTELSLSENPLSNQSLNKHIPAIQARGALVIYGNNPVPESGRDPEDSYNIELRFLGEYPPHQTEIVRKAARKWEGVLVGDIPSTHTKRFRLEDERNGVRSRFWGFEHPGGTIDDIIIYVAIESPEYVGQPSPDGFARTYLNNEESKLPALGLVVLKDGHIDPNLALHEIGHAVGFSGGIIDSHGLLHSHRGWFYFTGFNAMRVFVDAYGGNRSVLFDAGKNKDVGVHLNGTDSSHWGTGDRVNDVMAYSGGVGSDAGITALTAAALDDMGHTVNYSNAAPLIRKPPWRPAAKLSVDVESFFCGGVKDLSDIPRE